MLLPLLTPRRYQLGKQTCIIREAIYRWVAHYGSAPSVDKEEISAFITITITTAMQIHQ